MSVSSNFPGLNRDGEGKRLALFYCNRFDTGAGPDDYYFLISIFHLPGCRDRHLNRFAGVIPNLPLLQDQSIRIGWIYRTTDNDSFIFRIGKSEHTIKSGRYRRACFQYEVIDA